MSLWWIKLHESHHKSVTVWWVTSQCPEYCRPLPGGSPYHDIAKTSKLQRIGRRTHRAVIDIIPDTGRWVTESIILVTSFSRKTTDMETNDLEISKLFVCFIYVHQWMTQQKIDVSPIPPKDWLIKTSRLFDLMFFDKTSKPLARWSTRLETTARRVETRD